MCGTAGTLKVADAFAHKVKGVTRSRVDLQGLGARTRDFLVIGGSHLIGAMELMTDDERIILENGKALVEKGTTQVSQVSGELANSR